MSRKTYLVYPCGKKFEIRVPIGISDISGVRCSILPGEENYFQYAKSKFEINNLRVIEEEVLEQAPRQTPSFVSLTKKIRCVD